MARRDGARAVDGTDPVDPAPAKAQLRARLSARRRARRPAELAAARAAIRDAVLARCVERAWRCVAAYEPLRTEPGSTELLAGLAAAGVRVLVPLLLEDRDLDWTDWTARSAGASPLGRDAIAAADAVLVPALAVSVTGVRLGRGGGSYDRALRRVRPGAVTAALLFADELLDAVPHEPWDVPVGAAVTPAGWRALGT